MLDKFDYMLIGAFSVCLVAILSAGYINLPEQSFKVAESIVLPILAMLLGKKCPQYIDK